MSESINTVQNRIGGETQVPQQIFVGAAALEGNGLRAFMGAGFRSAFNTDALRLVRNGDKPAMRGQKGF
jgi:hypothetical protein